MLTFFGLPHADGQRLMNHVQQTLEDVESHMLMCGISSTYDRWIHHGEPLRTEPRVEPEPNEEAHHAGEGGNFKEDDIPQKDDDFEEEDGYEDDKIPDLFK